MLPAAQGFTVILAVLFKLIVLLHAPSNARFVTVIVVAPSFARFSVTKVPDDPDPAVVTTIVEVRPVARLGALKLYVTV